MDGSVRGEARVPYCEEQAAGLYRRLSGKDPHVARAEVLRIIWQLGALDARVRGPLDRRGPARRLVLTGQSWRLPLGAELHAPELHIGLFIAAMLVLLVVGIVAWCRGL